MCQKLSTGFPIQIFPQLGLGCIGVKGVNLFVDRRTTRVTKCYFCSYLLQANIFVPVTNTDSGVERDSPSHLLGRVMCVHVCYFCLLQWRAKKIGEYFHFHAKCSILLQRSTVGCTASLMHYHSFCCDGYRSISEHRYYQHLSSCPPLLYPHPAM